MRRPSFRWLHRRQRSAAPTVVAVGVLLCIAIPALAATPKPGKWQGSVPIVAKGLTQPVTVKFSTVPAKAGGQRVKGFSLGSFKLDSCTGGEHFATSGFKATVKPKVTQGKFKFTETIGDKTLKVTGRFLTKTQASGTAAFTVSSGATCATGKRNWAAELK